MCLNAREGVLFVSVAGNSKDHRFWLANIQDPCIIELEMWTKREATVDVGRSKLYLSTGALTHCSPGLSKSPLKAWGPSHRHQQPGGPPHRHQQPGVLHVTTSSSGVLQTATNSPWVLQVTTVS